MADEPAGSLNVRISGQTNTDDIVVGVCYRPADQEEEIDVTFFRQLEEDSYSQYLVLIKDLSHPAHHWKAVLQRTTQESWQAPNRS